MVSNQQNCSIADVWDGTQLRITFRRCFDQALMLRWYDLVSIAESLALNSERDTPIWKFDSKGVYTVSSFYAVVNFRGISPVYIPSLWKIHIPPRVHVFLWMLSKNKLLTRLNLSKRQNIPDLSCLFCVEPESVMHLFFECAVAKEMWRNISPLTGLPVVTDYLSVARLWICEKTHKIPNIVHSVVLWSMWKFRNDMCLNRISWSGMQVMYLKLSFTLVRWKPLPHHYNPSNVCNF